MQVKEDGLSTAILILLAQAVEPLETKEIESSLQKSLPKLPSVSRVKILYRLNRLRGDGLIRGKPVGSGKGTWIWWSANWFAKGGERGQK